MRVVLVEFVGGECSVRTEDGRWWCGADGWVHPTSSHWHMTPTCWNLLFASVESARDVAATNEWIVVGVLEDP